jgi:hypothetical protein
MMPRKRKSYHQRSAQKRWQRIAPKPFCGRSPMAIARFALRPFKELIVQFPRFHAVITSAE